MITPFNVQLARIGINPYFSPGPVSEKDTGLGKIHFDEMIVINSS
jgi:hypothetical protein